MFSMKLFSLSLKTCEIQNIVFRGGSLHGQRLKKSQEMMSVQGTGRAGEGERS